MNLAFAGSYLLITVATQAQTGGRPVPPGVSISHFSQIDRAVYAGSKPKTDRDFQYLQSLHIRYIVQLHFLPFLSVGEKKHAARYGMVLLSVPMNASPMAPSEKHVDEALRDLHNERLEPVYVHCVLGRDRTNLVAGLYRIYFLHIPKALAWEEMRESGFHTWWFVRGLRTYFDRHANTPPPFLRRLKDARDSHLSFFHAPNRPHCHLRTERHDFPAIFGSLWTRHFHTV
jgi:protein-tyrosine phosphatase